MHDSSGSGATLFVEPMAVVEANNEIRVLKSAEREEIERIIARLSATVGDIADNIIYGYENMVDLDIIFAKAKYAIEQRSFAPKLVQDGTTNLKNARHPLINRDVVVPTNIALGDSYDTLVVTGPNTGGKTVTLKTLGLLSIMAQCGLMIPAAEGSTVNVFTKILADIGDEQSIEQSLSTFSSHMKNIVSILEHADKSSLVLLDELGAGTDPIEGAALGIAILEKLHEQGARIAATTHYAEMKMYALEQEYVENASCEFDVTTLRPTYRLLMGIPGKSNAFSISKRLGLADEIVMRAQDKISSKDEKFEDVVSALNEKRRQLENKLETAERERERTAKLLGDAKEKYDRITKDADHEIDKARAQAQKIVSDIKSQAQELQQEIAKLRKEKNSSSIDDIAARARKLMRSDIAKLEDAADPVAQFERIVDEDYKLPRPLVVGDTVTIAGLSGRATVSDISKDKTTVTVTAGVIKTKVAMSDIRLVQDKKPKRQQSAVKTNISKVNREALVDVDLRGMSADEALMELDRFIDNCVIMNTPNITVIHGIGTGVLKVAVRQHLRRHKSVRTSRPGIYGEGEDGVTIVELK